MKIPTPLTDRVNTEPAIINGMSASEAHYIAVVSFGFSVLVGGALFAVTGFWPLLVILCILGPLFALWYGSLYLQTIKRDRPDGYYVQSIHIWLSNAGLIQCKFNRHNRFYEIGGPINIQFNPPVEVIADSQDLNPKKP